MTATRNRFDRIVRWLEGAEAGQLAHSDLEERLEVEGRELFRQMLQDHLDLRAQREPRLEVVVGADGVARGSVETGHERGLQTVFEQGRGHAPGLPAARPRQPASRRRGAEPAGRAPLPRAARLAVLEGTRGSFDDVREAVRRSTGQRLGKRQLEEFLQRAAIDFDAFYEKRKSAAGAPGDVIVISCDGKGVVMRPDALRAATAQAAARSTTKLATRLSKGEKRNRKRMAEVGAVYDAEPVPRTPDDILADSRHQEQRAARPAPRARNKWLMASVEEDAATVVSRVVDEAERRDLARAILKGQAAGVAAAVRRTAARERLDRAGQATIDECAGYLARKRPYLDYPTVLERGWPIATGIIEGACRHLVKDRMDITGARWGLDGAEAVLKMRAVVCNGDFAEYRRCHLAREHERVHRSRYAAAQPHKLPIAA